MIDLYNQVPVIYNAASRDFQYLSWLVNVVLNSVKHNIDDMYDLPNVKADPMLIELLAQTLGFKVRRNYDQKQLIALVGVIPYILRYKGTKKAIVMAVQALITASNAQCTFDEDEHCRVVGKNTLELTLPKELVDVTLFTDLLPYILPAGMTCKIIRRTQLNVPYGTNLVNDSILRARWHEAIDFDNSSKYVKGLSSMFSPGEDTPVFTNYRSVYDDAGHVSGYTLNEGLLDNNVIPSLDGTNGPPILIQNEEVIP